MNLRLLQNMDFELPELQHLNIKASFIFYILLVYEYKNHISTINGPPQRNCSKRFIIHYLTHLNSLQLETLPLSKLLFYLLPYFLELISLNPKPYVYIMYKILVKYSA